MKKTGEKYWSGKRMSGKNFVGEKFSHLPKIYLLFPDVFFPDKVDTKNQN